MEIKIIKKKLREIKKLEMKIRFGRSDNYQDQKLVWNQFFSTKDIQNSDVKYSISGLSKCTHEEMKEIIDEYFAAVYYQYFRENGIILENVFDPRILEKLGLSPSATWDDVKDRFRRLAKEHHPDQGGDSTKFIELHDAYKKLKDNK